ncbi:hypothetical protein Acr_12g0010140 [Actinidia rufa]|uniref:Uncharacterized protein n=1 Tax=Actinidia rufa TaxID=165716 RepID=A0A7J0FIR7_9ERIC|nr:hypothetical protein Acr_12g0010140 [Actinidia rufa]
MSAGGECDPQEMTAVAVAVAVAASAEKEAAERYLIVTWALPYSAAGDSIPIEELDANVVEMYVQDEGHETIVIQNTLSSQSIMVSERELLRMGRVRVPGLHVAGAAEKPKSSAVPSIVLKLAPEAYNIYVVARHRLLTTSANALSTSDVLLEPTGGPLKQTLTQQVVSESRWLAIYGWQHTDTMGLQETLDGAEEIQGDSRWNKVHAAYIAYGKVALDGVMVDGSR